MYANERARIGQAGFFRNWRYLRAEGPGNLMPSPFLGAQRAEGVVLFFDGLLIHAHRGMFSRRD